MVATIGCGLGFVTKDSSAEVGTAQPGLYRPVMGRAWCNPPSPRIPHATLAFGVVVGTTSSGESVRAIMDPLIHAGAEAKIVFQMTGSADLQIEAIHMDGTRIRPTHVVPHTSDEWGVFFRFDRPGCWQIHAKRGTAQGDVWFIAGPAL